MRKIVLSIVLLLWTSDYLDASSRFSGFYRPFVSQQGVLLDAIKQSETISTPRHCRVSGLIVPHHLLAVDLIANGFRYTSTCRFHTIIVLFPDHFRRTTKAFATTRRGFDTVFGGVRVDQRSVQKLLDQRELVEASDLFEKDHGIGAILPFIARYHPEATIVPIAVSAGSQKSEWDRMADLLKPLTSTSTLVLQSTDFSHYLSVGDAKLHDQQTFNIMAASDVEAAAKLVQPAHVDSVGALYIQMKLQDTVFRATPLVLFNANTQSYVSTTIKQTTTYVTAVYETEPAPLNLSLAGSRVVCFGGDTFFGRRVASFAGSGGTHAKAIERLESWLGGCPLVVNLAGAVLPEPVANPRAAALFMTRQQLESWTHALKVAAVSVANNHAQDFGDQGAIETTNALRQEKLTSLASGVTSNVQGLQIVAFSDGDNVKGVDEGLIAQSAIDRLARNISTPPVVTMLHWGREYDRTPTSRQRELAASLTDAGASLILGAGSHVASTRLVQLGGGRSVVCYGLGNFLFDQSAERTSGAVVEMRLFSEGTFFTRLVNMPDAVRFEHAFQ